MSGLAQITNHLPVILVVMGGLVIIGVVTSLITFFMQMEAKRRNDLFFGSFVMFLIVVITFTGLLVMRDAMRDEIIKACNEKGVYYTIQEWDNGEVNLTKCNITITNTAL
jgi:hypothetical protein